MKNILFVCTGNICRSPTAEAIARHKAKELNLEDSFSFDSAAIDGYHVGELPDFRAVEVGQERGVSFDNIFSRRITSQDFERFDYLMCMDQSHYNHLMQITPDKYKDKVKLFLEFCDFSSNFGYEVSDPYYKYGYAFEEVFELLDNAINSMFKRIST